MRTSSISICQQRAVFVCFSFLFLLNSCKTELKTDPYANETFNKSFAANPPIATDVSISLLKEPNDWGNLLYEAVFLKEQVGSDRLAVEIGDSSKIVLHDDGLNGDKKAGDGIFSTVMNIHTDSLEQYLKSSAGEIKGLLKDNEQLFEFKGRLRVPVDKRTLSELKAFGEKEKFDFAGRLSLIAPSRIPLFRLVSEPFKKRALLVTDPSVINDSTRTFNPCTGAGKAGGAWTFGKLMTDMAAGSGISPADFTLNWLKTWLTNQTVNGDVVAARPNISSVINDWQILSGGSGAALDVNKAPFKLLAIVNRFDLRSGGGYGGGNAGEGRFVFCVLDAKCNPVSKGFNVIFEFGVNKTRCSSIQKYAQQWIDLAALPFPSSTYNDALQKITDQFAGANTNASKPNGSSLNQLRTNELALGVSPWELREFAIDAVSHQLKEVTTKREPQIPYNGSGVPATPMIKAFGEFVNTNEQRVIKDQMDLPDDLLVGGVKTPFLGGKAHTLDAFSFHWDAGDSVPGRIRNDSARFHISLNTCSGCHGGETNTGNFIHIGLPITGGQPSLSRFLTGDPAFSGSPFIVDDRANRPSAAAPIKWEFNDLERRGRDLLDLGRRICIPDFRVVPSRNRFIPFEIPLELTRQLTFQPLTMTH